MRLNCRRSAVNQTLTLSTVIVEKTSDTDGRTRTDWPVRKYEHLLEQIEQPLYQTFIMRKVMSEIPAYDDLVSPGRR
ncbi:unnamed protein product [Auanema sp. JU1783]|nr:unnamed protein product [Auanema sp. JU1783]